MRIWIIHQHAIPPTQMGPTRHFDLAAELIKRGHEVYIFASNFCHNPYNPISEARAGMTVPPQDPVALAARRTRTDGTKWPQLCSEIL